MIVDTMTLTEVVDSLKKEVEDHVSPKVRGKFGEDVYKRQLRSARKIASWKNKMVVFKPVPIQVKNGNLFYWKVVSFDGVFMSAILTDFVHKGKHYYMNVYNDMFVTLYTKHCIERYAERIIGLRPEDVSVSDVFYDDICVPRTKNGVAIFETHLPSPRHKCSAYAGYDDVLFLGEPLGDMVTVYRTCISKDMCHHTESKILQTIGRLVEIDGEYPEMESASRRSFMSCIHKCMYDEHYKETFIEFHTKMYLIYRLQLEYGTFNEPIEDVRELIKVHESALRFFGISTNSLSPYGEKNGIARKGELDYEGQKE